MIKRQRIYLDNSVIGGYFDPEFEEHTKILFAKTDFKFVISDITQLELDSAPPKVKDLLDDLGIDYEFIQSTDESTALAEIYIKEQVIGKASRNDCLHIAIATVAKVDVLVSWNFKHIVNLGRIRGFNSVNLKNGYQILEIRSPREVIDNGNT